MTNVEKISAQLLIEENNLTLDDLLENYKENKNVNSLSILVQEKAKKLLEDDKDKIALIVRYVQTITNRIRFMTSRSSGRKYESSPLKTTGAVGIKKSARRNSGYILSED